MNPLLISFVGLNSNVYSNSNNMYTEKRVYLLIVNKSFIGYDEINIYLSQIKRN